MNFVRTYFIFFSPFQWLFFLNSRILVLLVYMCKCVYIYEQKIQIKKKINKNPGAANIFFSFLPGNVTDILSNSYYRDHSE